MTITGEQEDSLNKIEIGQTDEFFHKITENDLDNFCKLTGDDNPLHMNDEYASKTNFKERVVHGMLTASFISTMIGTRIPGEGSLWYEQHIKFLAPVRIGDNIRIWAKVLHKSESQRIVVLQTIVYNQDGKKVIDGEAKVKVLKRNSVESENNMKFIENINGDKGGVIISGASRGIGAATAVKLAKQGYGVVVNYQSNKSQAEDVVKKIIDFGGRAIAIKADVRNKKEVEEMIRLAYEEFEHIEAVVNNASAAIIYKNFDEMSWEDIKLHLDVQIQGTFNICKAVLPYFVENKKGSIVNVTSIYTDNVPPINMSHYSLAKAALSSLGKSLAVEYGPKGIRVNAVSPGMTSTDMIANIPEKAKMLNKVTTPLRRLAEPEDVASVVAFLISEDSKHLTGETIRVCGGIVML